MSKLFFSTVLAALAVVGCVQSPQSSSVSSDSDVTFSSNTTGEVSISWIKDKPGVTMQTKQVFSDTPDSLLAALGLQDGIPSSISCFLMKTNDVEVLFDAGLGMETSLLIPTLLQQGKSPADIKLLYITHLHADHIGGMLNNGQVVFPEADVYLNKVEYDAWLAMPDDRNALQRQVLSAYADHLHLFAIGDTLPGGVVPMDAYGHTPGHTVFRKGNVLVIGDLLHGAALQLEHPEFCPFFDMDKEAAIESRKRILNFACENVLLMAGMHLPEPGFIQR